MNQENTIWQSLTSAQQQSVIDAYEESKDDDNLTTLDELKANYANWPSTNNSFEAI